MIILASYLQYFQKSNFVLPFVLEVVTTAVISRISYFFEIPSAKTKHTPFCHLELKNGNFLASCEKTIKVGK
jgi:hypothetical protein